MPLRRKGREILSISRDSSVTVTLLRFRLRSKPAKASPISRSSRMMSNSRRSTSSTRRFTVASRAKIPTRSSTAHRSVNQKCARDTSSTLICRVGATTCRERIGSAPSGTSKTGEAVGRVPTARSFVRATRIGGILASGWNVCLRFRHGKHPAFPAGNHSGHRPRPSRSVRERFHPDDHR